MADNNYITRAEPRKHNTQSTGTEGQRAKAIGRHGQNSRRPPTFVECYQLLKMTELTAKELVDGEIRGDDDYLHAIASASRYAVESMWTTPACLSCQREPSHEPSRNHLFTGFGFDTSAHLSRQQPVSDARFASERAQSLSTRTRGLRRSKEGCGIDACGETGTG